MKTYTLDNGNIKAIFLSFGAILHELWVKNRYGSFINVIQGLKNLNEYISDSWSRGAIIGRYAGRLINPIKVNGKLYEIEKYIASIFYLYIILIVIYAQKKICISYKKTLIIWEITNKNMKE